MKSFEFSFHSSENIQNSSSNQSQRKASSKDSAHAAAAPSCRGGVEINYGIGCDPVVVANRFDNKYLCFPRLGNPRAHIW